MQVFFLEASSKLLSFSHPLWKKTSEETWELSREISVLLTLHLDISALFIMFTWFYIISSVFNRSQLSV